MLSLREMGLCFVVIVLVVCDCDYGFLVIIREDFIKTSLSMRLRSRIFDI